MLMVIQRHIELDHILSLRHQLCSDAVVQGDLLRGIRISRFFYLQRINLCIPFTAEILNDRTPDQPLPGVLPLRFPKKPYGFHILIHPLLLHEILIICHLLPHFLLLSGVDGLKLFFFFLYLHRLIRIAVVFIFAHMPAYPPVEPSFRTSYPYGIQSSPELRDAEHTPYA